MTTTTTTATVRILPNNKVYRQLFDAQVQLSETYNRVRENQLAQAVQIVAHPDATPLVRNIRPHESDKRQWLSSLPFNSDSKINPVAIFYRDEDKRRRSAIQREIDDVKQEVFNLPDNLTRGESKDGNDNNAVSKENVTERLAGTRQVKFNQLWTEFMNKLADLNQNLIKELETLTRECNTYYEGGQQDIDDQVQMSIYQKEITSLNIHSFASAFDNLDRFLPPRLSTIQDYCQSMEELELERVNQIRGLFKFYSDRLYRTHHLSDEETAGQLEKLANELNAQILENRKVYTELEARLLSGETERVHRFRATLAEHQAKWRDAMWIIHKQTWISKLSQSRAKLDSKIASACDPVGSSIAEETRHFVEHIHSLNSFIPPLSTKENGEQWYQQGQDLVNVIVTKQKELLRQLQQIIDNDIDFLEKESQAIRDKVLHTQVYDHEQIDFVFERDVQPLLEERQQFLQEQLVDRSKAVYTRFTQLMYRILDRLIAFIQPPAEQWDEHQIRLEQVTGQLLNLMRDCRRPHDLQNEKKLTKLDATLDEMRSASNEAALARLLTSAYEQLDAIKASYGDFYEMEHGIVDKYSEMIAEEVLRYKSQMLEYFRVREIDPNADEALEPDTNRVDPVSPLPSQLYTTSIARTTYEIADHLDKEPDLPPTSSPQQPRGELHSSEREHLDSRTRLRSPSRHQDQGQTPTFLTEDTAGPNESIPVPFSQSFRIPSDLVSSVIFNLSRAFLDYFDQWREETTQRAEAVMYSKHDELEKEMDFQMHLHEPRRIRIETDIHNVRAAELVMHDERVERHIHGVQETLEQTDTDYRRMLTEFSKSIVTYKDEISSLEQVFVNATTSGRLLSLQNRLSKKRDTFMETIRVSLRTFRKRFDDAMQYLRQANMNFRKSFKMFSDGGNFSRDEIEVYRKKLEKTAGQIDKAETAILKEMEKLEKKQLEDATKIMNQFQERFKNHLTDLQFIEVSNRWISDTQVKIKSEVAVGNQQAQSFKTNVQSYCKKLDALVNPNLDKQTATLGEVRELFQQIVQSSYERALYLKCLQNELLIPSSLVNTLKNKGLISEVELVKDLVNMTTTDESSAPRRASKMSVGGGSIVDETKSVKFASSTSATTRASSANKVGSSIMAVLTGAQPEEMNTIATIRTLLHKSEQPESDEIVEPGTPAALGLNTRSIASASSSHSSQTKRSSPKSKKRSSSQKGSSVDETPSGVRRDRPARARTRDEIFGLYCTFGEKPQIGQDFLSKIMNVLREATEGLLSHGELYYREKGSRPVTRPQAVSEKFDEFAQTMIEKLRKYDDQCRAYHENSVNEFREKLELVERTSPLMAKLEFDEQVEQAEKVLTELKQQFDKTLDEKLTDTNQTKADNFEQLRPVLGHPARKTELQELDQREKQRQDAIQQAINQLRSNTMEDVQTNAQATVHALASNAERLIILFDDILTADEVIRTKQPATKHPLSELVKRQQSGRPLEDPETQPLIERKQGHWPGLPLLEDPTNRRREPHVSRKRSSVASQRAKTSASIVTQKTTLPQVETIARRDRAYERYKNVFTTTSADIDQRCSASIAEVDRHRSHWLASIEKVQQLRTS